MKNLIITIEENEDIVQVTEEVLRLLKQGFTSGYEPTFEIISINEKSE